MFQTLYLIIVISHLKHCWTFAPLLKSSHENLKNSLLWTIHLDPQNGLFHGPQRINESFSEQDLHLEICSCLTDAWPVKTKYYQKDAARSGASKNLESESDKNLICRLICKKRQEKTKADETDINLIEAKRIKKESGKYKIAVISFIMDEDNFDDERLSTKKETLMASFECLKNKRCQSLNSDDINAWNKPANHNLVKRSSGKTLNKNTSKQGKNHGKKPSRTASTRNSTKSTPSPKKGSNETVKMKITMNNSSTSKVNNHVVPSRVKPLTHQTPKVESIALKGQLSPQVCFMILCPDKNLNALHDKPQTIPSSQPQLQRSMENLLKPLSTQMNQTTEQMMSTATMASTISSQHSVDKSTAEVRHNSNQPISNRHGLESTPSTQMQIQKSVESVLEPLLEQVKEMKQSFKQILSTTTITPTITTVTTIAATIPPSHQTGDESKSKENQEISTIINNDFDTSDNQPISNHNSNKDSQKNVLSPLTQTQKSLESQLKPLLKQVKEIKQNIKQIISTTIAPTRITIIPSQQTIEKFKTNVSQEIPMAENYEYDTSDGQHFNSTTTPKNTPSRTQIQKSVEALKRKLKTFGLPNQKEQSTEKLLPITIETTDVSISNVSIQTEDEFTTEASQGNPIQYANITPSLRSFNTPEFNRNEKPEVLISQGVKYQKVTAESPIYSYNSTET